MCLIQKEAPEKYVSGASFMPLKVFDYCLNICFVQTQSADSHANQTDNLT